MKWHRNGLLLEELGQTLLQGQPHLLTICMPACLVCTHPILGTPEKFLILPRDMFVEFPSVLFSVSLWFSAI